MTTTRPTVAFLTQHGKETLVKPILEPALGCQIVLAQGFDTDQLGTFTGDVPRLQSQLDTAREKARIGRELCGTTLSLASEGAFVPDPFSGLMPWNIEVLMWTDSARQLEVVGIAQGPARHAQRSVRSWAELEAFAHEAGFPQHRLVVRSAAADSNFVRKGIDHWQDLQSAFEQCQQLTALQRVDVESDLRAFCNPTRQSMIQRACHDLLQKLQSHCPSCDTVGFSVTHAVAGLRCQTCHSPTRLAQAHVWACQACGYTKEVPSLQSRADPSRCDHCNP